MNTPVRRLSCANLGVGLAVGLVAPLLWHVFTAPTFSGGGGGTMSRAYETALVLSYVPAPAWTPTVYLFPVISGALFGLVEFIMSARITLNRATLAPTIRRNGALGTAVGLGIAAWARLVPPTFQGLTEDAPLRFNNIPQQYLWLIFPGFCAVIAVTASAAIASCRHSRARRMSRE